MFCITRALPSYNMSQLGLVTVEKSSLSNNKSERINAKQPIKKKKKVSIDLHVGEMKERGKKTQKQKLRK